MLKIEHDTCNLQGRVVIDGKESTSLDLYNVDYVCKVSFVNHEFRIEKLEGEANVQDQGAK